MTKEELHAWANSVTEAIACEVGGLDTSTFWFVRQIVHDVRDRVLADDYSAFTHWRNEAKKRCMKTADMFETEPAE
jgi:hypothetical protein